MQTDGQRGSGGALPELGALFARLTRAPDLEAPELQAYDATDRLLLETAAGLPGWRAVPDRDDRAPRSAPGEVVVLGDRHGALTLGAIVGLDVRGIRVFQDPKLGELALARNAAGLGLGQAYETHPLGESLLSGARLVLMQLPRSLSELDELADAIARWAPPGVVVLAGGRVKHMTRAMNDVLGRYFAEVSAGLAQRKSRILTARSPRHVGAPDGLGDSPFPVWGRDPELPFAVAAFGATFGGATLDHGSRLLLSTLVTDEPVARIAAASAAHPASSGDPTPTTSTPTTPTRIVDLGCGNGVLAVSAALRYPDAQVIATDQSAGAVAAARLTAEAAGVAQRVAVHRADALDAVADGWAELILLNPPFHTGATVHAGVAHRLIRSCTRALAPGGELRLVFNSSLGYRPLVEREIGPTRQLARNRAFTVLSATRRE